MKVIKFLSFGEKTEAFANPPLPAVKHVPDWYKRQQGSVDDETAFAKGGMTSTIKRCMPIFDAMTAGYIVSAPCDIYIDATNPEKLSWSIPQALRPVASDLVATHGFLQYDQYPIDTNRYHKELFRIMPFWVIKTPPGYSALFMTPMNRFDIPFLNTTGIVDSDKVHLLGTFPFFIPKGWEGTIPAGTPYVQILPFKRENWEHSLEFQEEKQIYDKMVDNIKFYRQPDGGIYKNKIWDRREYK
jgi:hypothetical protein